MYAGIATIVCLVVGYVLAYAIAFKAGRWKNLMLVLVIAPFFTSFLLRTLSWKLILADDGWVVDVAQTLHLTDLLHLIGLTSDDRLLATPFAVIAGLTYNFLPFMVLPLYASLEKIDVRLIEASGDLYASPITGFFKVTFPLSLPGVVAGTLLTFIPAAGDYVNASCSAAPTPAWSATSSRTCSRRQGDYAAAGALSVISDGRSSWRWCWSTSAPQGRRTWYERVRAHARWIGKHLVLGLGLLVLVYTFVPIAVVVLMSFNDNSKSRNVYKFQEFTWDNWLHPCKPGGMGTRSSSASRSRSWRRWSRRSWHAGGVRARASPVRGSQCGQPDHLPADGLARDRHGLVAAGAVRVARLRWAAGLLDDPHRARDVLPVVRHRDGQGAARGLDDNLEQAAMDLYANESQTFWRVTFPLVLPGIVGAALLSFSLSFDDFIITNLNAGQEVTFPMFVYGSSQRGVPMQVNVIGTAMFLISIVIVVGNEIVRRRQEKAALAGARPARRDHAVERPADSAQRL